jgi:hypothetical protein
MDKQSWSKPVTVEQGLALFRTITNTDDAWNFLLNHWPVRGGKMRLKAMKIFVAVLADGRPQDDARTAFVEAAQEAGIFVKTQLWRDDQDVNPRR